MAELNFTAPTPVQMDAFLKAFIKKNVGFATTDYFKSSLQAPIVKMRISATDTMDRSFEFPCQQSYSYLNQAERRRDGVNKTVIMLFVVNIDTPSDFNY